MRASVIIPSYNAASTLPETIESILPQLTEQDEIIIVDDGSTDGTENCIRSYIGDRVRYIRQDNSGGPASPRNTGIKAAKGKYIFLFDSDDLMLPGKIDTSVSALEQHPDAGLVFTNFRTIDEEGKILKYRFLDAYSFINELSGNYNMGVIRIDTPEACLHLAKENFIGTSGVAIPASIVKKNGQFDEKVQNSDDRDMWFRITRNHSIIYLPEEFHCYRIRKGSISYGNDTKRAESKLIVLKKQLENPINPSFESDIKNLISYNYHDIAYDALNSRRYKSAQNAIKMALKYKINYRNIALFFKIVMTPELLSFLRQLKHKLMTKNR